MTQILTMRETFKHFLSAALRGGSSAERAPSSDAVACLPRRQRLVRAAAAPVPARQSVPVHDQHRVRRVLRPPQCGLFCRRLPGLRFHFLRAHVRRRTARGRRQQRTGSCGLRGTLNAIVFTTIFV